MSFRIVQVVQEFSLEGGVETVAFELQRAWDAAGVPSTVLASAAPDPGTTRILLVAPWLSKIPTRGQFRHLGRLIVVPWFTLAATKEIRLQHDAVVLSHGDTLAGDALVIHAVNRASLVEKSRAGNQRWRLNPMHYWVGLRDRRMIGGLRFRRYVAVSKRVADEIQDHYGVPEDRIVIIPNGINLDRFSPNTTDRPRIRAEFNVPEAAPLLLLVGHEFERKGLSYVIDGLSRLGPETRLLVVGSDDSERYRKQAAAAGIADRVIFAGARRDVPAFYRAADAFVFPTAYESFSLVCMEALACGVPIFATRAGGIEDYMKDGVNGFGITRDGADIAAKLAPALNDPALLARLREGARMTAEGFGWPAIAARYETLLREIWQERMTVTAARS